MLTYLGKIGERFWMGVYLRILAIAFVYGAAIHLANILGWGEKPWNQTPLTWRVGDVVYGLVDTITAIGLWQRTAWGIFSFLVAIASQFVIYTVFIDRFAFNAEQRQTIYGLIGTEAILVVIFVILAIFKK